MNVADKQYKELIEDIANYGYSDAGTKVRGRYESDNSPAYSRSLVSRKMRFQPNELALITSKFTAWKWATLEMLLFYQIKTNKKEDFHKHKLTIWDQWFKKDNTIGKSYGYQLGKISKKSRKYPVSKLHTHLLPKGKYKIRWWTKHIHLDQVDYLIHELINNPSSKRHIIEHWNPDELDHMALTPCFHKIQLHVKEGCLHMELRGRSSDTAVGLAFNMIQYHVLLHLLAQVCGYGVGEFIIDLGDAHIYERHIDEVIDQVNGETFNQPTLWINPEIKSFYDFTIDDIKIIGYRHGKKRKYEIVV